MPELDRHHLTVTHPDGADAGTDADVQSRTRELSASFIERTGGDAIPSSWLMRTSAQPR
ncbi:MULTISPECIES: hypothetical protein [Kribbella]|uniref:hypothetical protein n=1 Tax=Kribbella TaxID=182639 RepID=UPI0031D756BD